MDVSQRILVIGGGVAGLTAAEAARETDPAARIHLISDEAGLPYYRSRICPLLAGGDLSKLSLRNHQWFTDQRIQLVHGRVEAISAAAQQVILTDDVYLNYDSLVLATGAAPQRPKLNGGGGLQPLPLRTLEDAQSLREHPGPVAVLGDGPLAFEAAWHFSRAGRNVTLVGRGRRLLARQTDKEAASFLLHLAEQTDIRIALQGDSLLWEKQRLILSDGRAFPAACVVAAAGSRPELTLATNTNLLVQHGLVVDERMATSLPHIWAAGDCVEYQGQVTGRWSAAMAQGRVAGINAAGGEASYQPEFLPWTLNAMGVQLWSGGDFTAPQQEIAQDPHGPRLVKLFFRDNILVGVILIGRDQPTLKARKLLQSPTTRQEALSLLNEK